MSVEEDLYANFVDFVNSADMDFEKKLYNPAVSSYFKALAILCDWKIYKERRVLSKNHSERFLFLETHFKEAYNLLSPLFKEYRDSYNIRMTKQDALKLKKNVKRLQELFNEKN